MGTVHTGVNTDRAIDRASRLFRFLAEVQRLKARPAFTVEMQAEDGHLLWFNRLPDHPAVWSAHRSVTPEADAPFLMLDRIPQADVPEPDEQLARWLDGPFADPDQPPTLCDEIPDLDADVEPLFLDDHPDVRDAYRDWFRSWQDWADAELRDRPVRDLYAKLFATYVAATSSTETLELVVGLGCLAWQPLNHPPVRRHMLVTPVALEFDDSTGRLTLARVESRDALSVELDMLDPGLLGNPQRINDIRSAAQNTTTHPLDRDNTAELARRLVFTLDSRGDYRDDYRDDDAAPHTAEPAIAAFAPALILRKRSQQGLIRVFDKIVDHLAELDEVPDGLLPLIDPDRQPRVEPDHSDGAVVTVDDEPFLPLPVNDKQLRIITATDRKAQVLVQGPPGTGKTHTAAALLSHLLARGKRVLVTAHTDRALREVRDKLPEEIKPLSVSVVGSSHEDMADLKTAVEYISTRASEHDAAEAAATIQHCLDTIESLRRERARLYRELLDAREAEVTEREHADENGTLAAIAQRHNEAAEAHSWLTELLAVPAEETAPLTDAEALEWLRLLTDPQLAADEAHSRARLTDLSELPDPDRFANLVDAEATTTDAERDYDVLLTHPAYGAVRRMNTDARQAMQQRLHQLADTADALARRREPWLDQALSDVRSGRANTWRGRAQQLAGLIDRARPMVDELDPLARVEVTGEPAPQVSLARTVTEQLAAGKQIKTNPDGSPKLGFTTPKFIKHAASLFENVRVNGLPPTTLGQLGTFLLHRDATDLVDALDRAWPETVEIPDEDTLHERLQWHVTELEQLHAVLQLAADLDDTENRLIARGLPQPDWNDLDSVRVYARLVDAAAATDAAHAAQQPLQHLEERLTVETRWSDTAACLNELLGAVSRRDRDDYAAAHRRLEHLHDVRLRATRRDALAHRLLDHARPLRDAIEADPHDEAWPTRLGGLTTSWRWAATASWIAAQTGADVNTVQHHINTIDQHIRDQVELIAATRAWSHAVSDERITGSAKANLQQYAQLVRRLGKGTGQYAAQRRAEIRQAMDRCRPAVPVWIMPLYRIAEQLRVEANMFDVVIVDEASQAGVEAAFLQFLAPRIVVIGDDKQVSPSAVGVDQKQLRDLANQYLADDPYKSTWQDPQRSFFDEAKMRYGGTITLTEHRRCVPEIIGFSNRIAYEPEGIRLQPVRQYGADRLDPIRPVFCPDGHLTGSGKINPVEVDAIVAQIEKCLADPDYDGKTFGVISLLGDTQARRIESELLTRVHPDEWAARDLRCGNAADFQGSERDVMFLSMVTAPEQGRTMAVLTRDQFVQRFNVAVSRAKDQLWVFHSVRLVDLRNKEDLRFQLLDYCYGVLNRSEPGLDGHTAAVPDDVRVAPFDSLFEQRVFNRLIDRGHTVVPQYEVQQYRIDLVVIGGHTRLAIECDGDHWHGPDRYEADLHRQRDLERCGWTFFRIRESDFYIDRASVLRELWATLDELGIRPSGWKSDTDEKTGEPANERTDSVETGKAKAAPVLITDEQIATHTTVAELKAPQPVLGGEPDALVSEAAQRTSTSKAVFRADDPVSTEPVVSATTDPSITDIPMQESATAAAPTHKTDRSHTPGSGLTAYRTLNATLPPVREASRQQLIGGIVDIVEVEGPVVASRLHTAYINASGGRRVRQPTADALNDAIAAAVRKGLLIRDNPLRRQDTATHTFRTPNQPEFLVREPGPRDLDQIPPRELAATITEAAVDHGWHNTETLYRETLVRLGKKRLTDNVRATLDAARALCDTTETV